MHTAGIDLSSQDARTATCVLEWSSGAAHVAELRVGVSDGDLTALIGRVDKTGIDVPLGWPVAFAEAVAQHGRDGSWPEEYRHADTLAVRYRRTDLMLWATLKGSPPLSVSTDKIALPAMRAAALISRLAEPAPLDGTGIVVEAYPAAALRRWELPSRGYKRLEHAAARHELIDLFGALTSGWLQLEGETLELCRSSDDAFDAVIAALIARAAALGLVEPIPEAERAAARREGWIALPLAGSLAHLAGP